MNEREEFIKYIEIFKKHSDSVDATYESIKHFVDLDFWCENTFCFNPLILSLLSSRFGISTQWIEWFCFENDFGRDGKTAGEVNEPMRLIDDPGKLWDLVKGMNESGAQLIQRDKVDDTKN